MQKEGIFEKNIGSLLLLMVFAYLFSIGARMYWPIHFSDTDSMYHAGQLMINTNDGYFFASGARDVLDSVLAENKQRASAFGISPGLVLLTTYATKLLPFSFETVILYLPAVISSLIVIPIILAGRLMGNVLLGFFAALLGSIAWSYYNRTMVGYYDSDMFAILLQFTIFYNLLHVIYKKNMSSILIAAFFIFIYPYFYIQGMTIVFAVFIFTVVYLFLEYKGFIQESETVPFKRDAITFFTTVILLSIALMVTLPIEMRILLFVVATIFLFKKRLNPRVLAYIAIGSFIGFLLFSNIFQVMLIRLASYTNRGVTMEGLHFYQVIQTVREAGAIPMTTIANRISGSSLGLLLSFVGFIVLIFKHKPFIIALPLIGVGLFSYVGGLRFTVYAVPIAAISAIYLFHVIIKTVSDKKSIYIVAMTLLTATMLYPNIEHIIGYKVPTVLNKTEVNDLAKLNELSSRQDYTLAWWDYGYPIWYYSDTSTLIDGGKHQNDNFIISKIMQTSSPELAAHLSRVSVETYVDSNYSNVANTLFKNQQKDQLDPNLFLSELEDQNYKLPKKTRDIYLYLPYRMMNIFPTVAIFGNLDLTTGKAERKISFYPTNAVNNKNGIITFRNGITFDAKKGEITLGQQKKKVKNFIVTQNTKQGKIQLQSQLYHTDGEYAIVYMKSYGRFIVMDSETFNSTYVQMFMLEKYDKDLFELVVSSSSSKIYKLKI